MANKYTAKQIEFLRIGYRRMKIHDLTCAFNAQFGTDKPATSIKAALGNRGIISGRTGYFEKGSQPWNAGTKGLGLTDANKGSFKNGHVPQNRRPLGSERICCKDGFVLIKIAERDPHTGFAARYKHKHVYIWEREHGPVPAGMVVAFRDSDKLNIEPENLMLISRAELLRLNQRGYKDTPGKLKPSILALSKLEVKTFALRRRREHEQD